MRNVIIFIFRYYFFFLFLMLEGAAVVLIIENSNYHNSEYINTANRVTAKVLETYNEVMEYLSLKTINAQLADENARLHSWSEDAFYKYDVEVFSVKDTIYRQQYKYMSAKVINNSTNKRNNYLTLNKGSNQGVKSEMGVIANNSVVGIVKDVSPNYSSVLSVLHKSARLSANLKSSKYFGSLVWEGNNSQIASLLDIPSHVVLTEGDTVMTSSFSSIFPEGMMLGTIEKFKLKQGENFYTISVKLSTNFSNLTYVQLVHNMMKKERNELETRSQND